MRRQRKNAGREKLDFSRRKGYNFSVGRKEKFLQFILKPPLWLCIVIWTVASVALGGSITLYYLGLGGYEWALPVHLVALVFAVLSVYAVLTVVGVPEKVKDKPKVRQFFSSYDTRAFVYAALSVTINICYIVFGYIIAALTHSLWLGVLVGYHIFLMLARLVVFVTSKFRGRGRGEHAQRNRIRSYVYSGFALILLAFAMSPVFRLVSNDMNNYKYMFGTTAYVCAIALYTFVKFGISVRNLTKVRKRSDLSLKALKNVSFADALISLYMLQAMMIKELHNENAATMAVFNHVFGIVIGFTVFVIGVTMAVRGIKRLLSLDKQNRQDDEPPALENGEPLPLENDEPLPLENDE